MQAFTNADAGNINLPGFAKKFSQWQATSRLKTQLSKTIQQCNGDPRAWKEIELIAQKIKYLAGHSLFPYRYVDYTTTVFGSTRLSADSLEFNEVSSITRALVSEKRMSIMTGGGLGIMKAANEGRTLATKNRRENGKKVSGNNIGLPIKLPREERLNNHLDVISQHENFGDRLNEFSDRTNASITWDGGFGSLLELSFIAQLKQVKHTEEAFPIIIKAGAWKEILELYYKKMYQERVDNNEVPLISESDKDLFTIVYYVDDAVQTVLDHYNKIWKPNTWDKLNDPSKTWVKSGYDKSKKPDVKS